MLQLYQFGNESVLNKLLEDNKGIIKKTINRFYINSNSIDEDDLFQEECNCLITAAKNYDFNNSKKAKFITYAVFWINQKINRFLKQKNTNDEMSLNAPVVGNRDNELTLVDVIPSDLYLENNIIEEIYQQELKKDIIQSMNVINTLSEREVIDFSFELRSYSTSFNAKPMVKLLLNWI